jgi:hypothetical protein
MKELLDQLLAGDLLTEATATQLREAVQKQLDEAIAEARQQAVLEVTAQLQTQWVAERDTLIEALDTQVTQALTGELSELKEDIDNFRDLEVETAERLVEAKKDMAVQLQEELGDLVEVLNSFVELRLEAELSELKEDISEAKSLQFGRKIFEAFADEFKKFGVDGESAEAKLQETAMRLEDTQTALEESQRAVAQLERTMKLEKILSPLQGRAKEVMEAILKSVETPMLEDAYNTYVGRVLRESASSGKTSEKEKTVLAEGKNNAPVVKGVAVTGDDNERILRENAERDREQTRTSSISDEQKMRLRRQAGLA